MLRPPALVFGPDIYQTPTCIPHYVRKSAIYRIGRVEQGAIQTFSMSEASPKAPRQVSLHLYDNGIGP